MTSGECTCISNKTRNVRITTLKSFRITIVEYASVALFRKNAKRMRHIVLSSVVCLAATYRVFHDFRA